MNDYLEQVNIDLEHLKRLVAGYRQAEPNMNPRNPHWEDMLTRRLFTQGSNVWRIP